MKLTPQAKVGLLTIVVICCLAAIVTWKNDLLLRRTGVELIASFQNVEGLAVGSEVRYRGFKVGKVLNIDPGPLEIRVYSVIDPGIKFPADSYLRIAFDGLVGLKYLDLRPGTAEALFTGGVLNGKSTAGIVDFVDIGAQNLQETKAILVTIRKFVEDPRIVSAFENAVMNAEKITYQLDELTRVLANIVTDPKFEADVKNTMGATSRTLTSASNFFENVGNIRVKPSGQIYFGNLANEVRGNLDIGINAGDFLRAGVGEGPTQNLTLQDILLFRKIGTNVGFKLGMINTKLGGGLDFNLNPGMILSADLYNINNKPDNPKLRFTTYNELNQYIDFTLRADDVLNGAAANYAVGLQVKTP
jgi:phospholipid/cholesterol/gamma-HCH transport system substrate-binding protein